MLKTKKTPERTVSKWWAEIGYNVTGWRPFISTLRQHYRADDKLPAIVNDPAIPRASLEHCFVNLALIEQVEHEIREKTCLSGALAAEADLERGDLYQSLLSTGQFCGIERLMGSFDDRGGQTGWACITGRAGTGKTTLLQHITYRWGMRDTLWHNRFDFVFRLKLNLMGQKDFWEGTTHSDVGYLSWLIYKSLGAASTFSLHDIHSCLTKETLKNKTLLLLDGFDEIQSLYGEGRDARVTALMDKALSFPNGILTSRPNAVPEPWISAGRFTRRYENIGLTEDNVCHYIQHYFDALSQPEMAESLLAELATNPEMMSLAQIPVNIAALCLTWDSDAKLQAAEDKKNMLTMTMLYQRVIVWLVRRYDSQCKASPDEMASSMNSAKIPTNQLLARHAKPLQALAALAYDAFESGEMQSLSHTLLSRHFPDYALLETLSTQWGILRAFALPEREGEYPRHYFIHFAYQEYFVALYMAQKLAEPPCDNREQEIARRQTIQTVTRHIQAKKSEPHYADIWTFLAGILSTPAYSRGADYFWDARIDVLEPIPLPIIGLHPHVKMLESQPRVYREALLTHRALHTTQHRLPEHLTILQSIIPSVIQWQAVRQIRALNPLWDNEYDVPVHKKIETARRIETQRQQQYEHMRETLALPRLSSLSPKIFFSQNSVWAYRFHMARSQRDEVSYSKAAQAPVNLSIIDAESLVVLRAALKSHQVGIQIIAAEALLKIECNDAESLAVLRAAVKGEDEVVRFAAVNILKHLAPYLQDSATLLVLLEKTVVTPALPSSLSVADDSEDDFGERSLSSLSMWNHDGHSKGMAKLARKLNSENNFRERSTSFLSMWGHDEHSYDFEESIADKATEELGVSLETFESIHITLLRILPVSYAAMPELLTNTTAQRFFVMSVWLHSSSVVLDLKNYQMFVDGQTFILLRTTAEIIAPKPKKRRSMLQRLMAVRTRSELPSESRTATGLEGTEEIAITPKVVKTFVKQLQVYQVEFISALESSSRELSPILHTLTQPIVLPRVTQVFEAGFLQDNLSVIPKEVESSEMHLFNALSDRFTLMQAAVDRRLHLGEALSQEQQSQLEQLRLMTESTQIHIRELETRLTLAETEDDVLSEHIVRLKGTLAQHSESIEILEKAFDIIKALQAGLAELQSQFAKEPLCSEEVEDLADLSPEQRIYAGCFKKILSRMHMTAMIISTGLVKVTVSSGLGRAGQVLNAISSCVPLGAGIGVKMLAYCLQAADHTMVMRRMDRLSRLGDSPDEVAWLAEQLSRRLVRCLTIENSVKEHHMAKLLSAAGEIFESMVENGFYGALTQVFEMAVDSVVDQVIDTADLSAIEKRAEQDAQLLLAAIAESDVLDGRTRDLQRLFLYALPMLTVVDRIFYLLIDQFCQQQICDPKNLDINTKKRAQFYGRITNSWHNQAAFVGEALEDETQRDHLITDVVQGFASKRHPDRTTGVFYFKENKGVFGLFSKPHASWNKAALLPETADDVINGVIARNRMGIR